MITRKVARIAIAAAAFAVVSVFAAAAASIQESPAVSEWSWGSLPTPAPSQSMSVSAISDDGGLIYTAGFQTMFFRSNNAGATWTTMTMTSGVLSEHTLGNLACSADGRTVMCAVPGEESSHVGISKDAGDTWNVSNPDPDGSSEWSQCAMSADGNVMLIGGRFTTPVTERYALLKSRDGGGNWTSLTLPGVGSEIISLACSADAAVILAILGFDNSSECKVYLSKDSGATWTPTFSDSGFHWTMAYVSKNGKTLMAASDHSVAPNSSLRLSRDSGATWHDYFRGSDGYNLLAIGGSKDGTALYACTIGGVFTCVAGSDWRKLDGPWSDDFYSVAASETGRVVFLGAGASGNHHITRNWGTTWQKESMGDYWYAVRLSPDASSILAASHDHLYLSGDRALHVEGCVACQRPARGKFGGLGGFHEVNGLWRKDAVVHFNRRRGDVAADRISAAFRPMGGPP